MQRELVRGSSLRFFQFLISVSLIDCKDSSIIGTTNIDVYQLATCQHEHRTFNLQFEHETSAEKNLPMFRKIKCEVEVSTDQGLLREPIANCLSITFDSIYNFKPSENDSQPPVIGFCAPTGSELQKNFTFPMNFPCTNHCNSVRFKRWMSLLHINGKGVSSTQRYDPFEFEMPQPSEAPENDLSINVLSRVLFNTEAVHNFKSLVDKSKQFVIELKIDDEHLMGFTELDELIHVGRKRIRKLIPLFKFDIDNFKERTDCESIFFKPPPPVKGKKSKEAAQKKNLKRKTLESESQTNSKDEVVVEQIELNELIPFVNECCKQFFVVVELEFEKALHDEVFYDSHESLFQDDEVKEVGDLKAPCNESSVEFESFTIKAQIFEFFNMTQEANQVFLQLIHKSPCEESWLRYAVHNLRRGDFGKTLACIDEIVKLNQISIVGHILQAYVAFKLEKFSECERLVNFMQSKHGDLLELSLIHRFVDIKTEKASGFKLALRKDFKVNVDIQKIYDATEVLWWSKQENQKFLSWQDSFVRSAIFFIKLGCFDWAELALSEYYATHGVNINYVYLLAVIDAIKGQCKNSLLHLNKLPNQDVANHHENYEKIVGLSSLMQSKLGNVEKAEKLFKSLSAMTEERIENFLTNLVSGTCISENSLLHLKTAVKIFPCRLSLNELGKFYQKSKNFEAAEKCFHQAINVDDNSESWQHLHEIHMKQNRIDVANLCKRKF